MDYDKNTIRTAFKVYVDWHGETTTTQFCDYLNNGFGFKKEITPQAVTSMVHPEKNRGIKALQHIGVRQGKQGNTIYYDKRRNY